MVCLVSARADRQCQHRYVAGGLLELRRASILNGCGDIRTRRRRETGEAEEGATSTRRIGQGGGQEGAVKSIMIIYW